MVCGEETMKTLTIKQPWAELILQKRKKIELRKWHTDFRGEFLIHSSKNPDKEAMERFGFSELPCGYIIGKVNLIDIKMYKNDDEFNADRDLHLANSKWGNNGFILADVERTNKIPVNGQLKFWDFKEDHYVAKSINSERDITKVCDFIGGLNLDYPNYSEWVQKCERELNSGYKGGFYTEGKDGIAGVLIFQPDKTNKEILEIKSFKIAQQYRKKGLCSLLFDSLEEFYHGKNFKKIQVDTHKENSLMINFLKKRFFKVVREEALYNKNQIEVILQKEIVQK
jgi:ribosomal protein S18 acetylase RimI-like enzyme